MQALTKQQQPTVQFLQQLQDGLLQASRHPDGPVATSQVLPGAVCSHIIKKVLAIVQEEPAVVDLPPAAVEQRVTVVGDLHGHFHDLCNMLQMVGHPSPDRVYVFNGDFVDRGAWGIEVLMLLTAYKWLLPHNVYLLRGNHETTYCTQNYGFQQELLSKYGCKAGKVLYKDVLSLFAQLPLAAVVEGNTLILHGGLFRVPPVKQDGQKRAPKGLDNMSEAEQQAMGTGSLADLRGVKKGSKDPNPDSRLIDLIASDVVWSDPSSLKGHHLNVQRGVGTRFGPDVTEAFLSSNKLKLIIRSHEGPDARHKRPPHDRMPSIDAGYCIDHDTPSGKLVTLFSAPDYPMFGEDRFHNRAAVLHLTAPDYATPEVQAFAAVLPRPQVEPYYVPEGLSSDDDEEQIERSTMGTHSSDTASERPVRKSNCDGQVAGPQQQAQQAVAISKQSRKVVASSAVDVSEPLQERRYPTRQRKRVQQ